MRPLSLLCLFLLFVSSAAESAPRKKDNDPKPGNGKVPQTWEAEQKEIIFKDDGRGKAVNINDLSSFDDAPMHAPGYEPKKKSIDQYLAATCEIIRENRDSLPQQEITRTTQYYTSMFAPGSNGRLQAKDRRACINVEGACIVDKLLYNFTSPKEPWGKFYVRNDIPFKFGRGSGQSYYNATNALDPCRTLAADKNVYPVGTVVYIPSMRDKICPQSGKPVDGCFIVGDAGAAIRGEGRFDIFTGECIDYDKASGRCADKDNGTFVAEEGDPFYVVGRHNMWAKSLREEVDLYINNDWSNGVVPLNNKEEYCPKCSEQDLNREIPDRAHGSTPITGLTPKQKDQLKWPEFQASWELKEGIYQRAKLRYNDLKNNLGNQRYVVVIDFSKNSNKRRFFLFDLLEQTVEKHITAHGKNSDPENTGYATHFSNEDNSLMSSLGAYVTLDTYIGTHGYSLRLSGIDSTNSNAEERAIVMHPADYVSDSQNHSGRSWGCPAIDPAVSKEIIDKVKQGALLYIGKDE